MQIQLLSQPTQQAVPNFLGYVKRRLGFALGRFADRIGRVTVRLSDVNGPRGGVDQRCQLIVAVQRRPPVIVEAADVHAHAALDHAAERAARAVDRSLKRVADRRLDTGT